MITAVSDGDGTIIRITHWDELFGDSQQTTGVGQMLTMGGQIMTVPGQQMTGGGSAFDPNQEIYQEYQNSPDPLWRARAFETWWTRYPRHDQKEAAKKLWMQMSGVSVERLNAALSNALATRQWQEQNGRFVPSAFRWLDGRWADYDNWDDTPQTTGKDGNPIWTEY